MRASRKPAPDVKRWLLPTTLGLAHGVADGAAGLLLGRLPRTFALGEVALLVLLYNVLAFGCQPVVGLLTDHWRRPRWVALGGLALLAAGLLTSPWSPVAAVALIGLGSAAFHVAGGALALCALPGRATGAGLFAAPGVFGLALGGYLAITTSVPLWPCLALLALLAAAVAALGEPPLPYTALSGEPVFERHDLIMLVLLAGIALRSLVWTTLQYVFAARVDALVLLALAATIGKLLGGVLADRFGWRRWTLLALGGAAALLTAGQGSFALTLVGVGLLQSATPAALAATLRLLPRQPAAAAGLGLGLAIAAGGLPLMLGLGGPLAAPPMLLAISVAAGGACLAALTWLRARPRLGQMAAMR
jgi:MFS transporter, FSR family, fosmidomycin resistance protein